MVLEYVWLTLIVTVLCLWIVNRLTRTESEKAQDKFERQFAIEQAERDRKVFQAKIEGTLTIDKLEEIYYPKESKNEEKK